MQKVANRALYSFQLQFVVKPKMVSNNVNMSADEMEKFFATALQKIQSRPKRKIRRNIREHQRRKVSEMEQDAQNENLSTIYRFFSLIRRTGTSDEGTPV